MHFVLGRPRTIPVPLQKQVPSSSSILFLHVSLGIAHRLAVLQRSPIDADLPPHALDIILGPGIKGTQDNVLALRPLALVVFQPPLVEHAPLLPFHDVFLAHTKPNRILCAPSHRRRCCSGHQRRCPVGRGLRHIPLYLLLLPRLLLLTPLRRVLFVLQHPPHVPILQLLLLLLLQMPSQGRLAALPARLGTLLDDV